MFDADLGYIGAEGPERTFAQAYFRFYQHLRMPLLLASALRSAFNVTPS